jgi:hypothetical protein
MTMMIAALALLGGEAMTILVENSSTRPISLKAAKLPDHYAPLSRAPLMPQTTDRVASREGKLFVPHDRSEQEAVHLHYTDAKGRGCIFLVAPTPHSASWQKLKPRAQAVGGATCEARTGRTIGDFVYVIR